VADVLKVVQHQLQNGPQGFTVGTDKISQLLIRRDAAVQGALEGTTLRHLVKDQPLDSVSDEEWEMSSEVDTGLSETNELLGSMPHAPVGFPKKSPSDLPPVGKWPSP
jgi:hypothetical protein